MISVKAFSREDSTAKHRQSTYHVSRRQVRGVVSEAFSSVLGCMLCLHKLLYTHRCHVIVIRKASYDYFVRTKVPFNAKRKTVFRKQLFSI